MIKGSKDKQAICLSALVLCIGAGFAVMAFTGIPALLPTGLLYAWIGVRGLRVHYSTPTASSSKGSPASPSRASIR